MAVTHRPHPLTQLCPVGLDLQYTINDKLMRFFDQCQRLVETVENNKDATKEVELFKNRPEMRRVQEKLADRLQLPYINVTTG